MTWDAWLLACSIGLLIGAAALWLLSFFGSEPPDLGLPF